MNKNFFDRWAVEVDDHFQDSHEVFVRFFPTKEKALAFINERESHATPFSANSSYRLIEIINIKIHPVVQVETEVPQPPVIRKKYIIG